MTLFASYLDKRWSFKISLWTHAYVNDNGKANYDIDKDVDDDYDGESDDESEDDGCALVGQA